ncbi:MAG: hypothetical protein NFCOHLIN_02045 [Gammaproteobacteria bacterium]|nr:hypothetical protein [Gammaproteobacteria bacterium]
MLALAGLCTCMAPVWSADGGSAAAAPMLLAQSTGGFTAGPATETAHDSDTTAAGAPAEPPADAKAPAAADKPAFGVESKAAETGQGGGWSNMMRSVTGFLGGSRAATEEPRVTATIGIRGLSAAQLGSANPDYNQVQRLEQQAVSQSDAMSFAQSGQLRPQNVRFLAPATR